VTIRSNGTLQDLIETIRGFDEARDWGKFHSPKNLAIALIIEAGELLEVFRWMTDEESRSIRPESDDYQHSAEELADVFIQLLRIANALDLDLLESARSKIRVDEAHYPVSSSRGNAKKYK
jgi:dCTP diphosphatase